MKSSTGRYIHIRYESDTSYGKGLNDYYSRTVVTEMPNLQELWDIMDNAGSNILDDSSAPINLKLRQGIAVRNPKESFNKKLGRELAITRMEDSMVFSIDLDKITIDPNEETIHLSFKSGSEMYYFGIKNGKVVFYGSGIYL